MKTKLETRLKGLNAKCLNDLNFQSSKRLLRRKEFLWVSLLSDYIFVIILIIRCRFYTAGYVSPMLKAEMYMYVYVLVL